MRAFLLYTRSRQVPASVAAAALCCLFVRVTTPAADLRWTALAITAAVSALAVGLTGQDADLDRAAAWPWPLYRVAHVLAIATIAAALVADTAPMPFVVRGCVGMTGLAALGAALFGGHLAWVLPCGWFAVTFFSDTWLSAPADSFGAGWVAAAFGATGAATYASLHSTLKL